MPATVRRISRDRLETYALALGRTSLAARALGSYDRLVKEGEEPTIKQVNNGFLICQRDGSVAFRAC